MQVVSYNLLLCITMSKFKLKFLESYFFLKKKTKSHCFLQFLPNFFIKFYILPNVRNCSGIICYNMELILIRLTLLYEYSGIQYGMKTITLNF